MDQARRRQYLEAMGVQSWEARSVVDDEVVPAPTVHETQAAVEEPVPSVFPETANIDEVREEKRAAAVAPAPSADESELPSWLLEEPPLTEDFVPAAEPSDYPADLAPMAPHRDDLSGLDWNGLAQRVAQCERCELHKTRTNTVFGVGNHEADLLVIGEAPGADEDRQGEPFVGRAGQLLNAMLLAIGLKREQVFIANILKCRPPGNRDPRAEETLQCEPYLRRQIELLKPKAILCVGRVAAQNLLKSDDAVGRMRGKEFFLDQIPVIVTYHPAYLLRSPDQKAKAWVDLQSTLRKLS